MLSFLGGFETWWIEIEPFGPARRLYLLVAEILGLREKQDLRCGLLGRFNSEEVHDCSIRLLMGLGLLIRKGCQRSGCLKACR